MEELVLDQNGNSRKRRMKFSGQDWFQRDLIK